MTQNTDPILAKWLAAGDVIGNRTAAKAELAKIADLVANECLTFNSANPFCLWLVGDLGAGKTTLTGAVLRSFGLDPNFPVTSPTFTYLNEYEIKGRWYAHIDLYRAAKGFSLEELGFLDSRAFSGYFIEWPAALGDTTDVLPPTHVLQIDPGQSADERLFTFFRIS